jgi:hypothetical protein
MRPVYGMCWQQFEIGASEHLILSLNFVLGPLPAENTNDRRELRHVPQVSFRLLELFPAKCRMSRSLLFRFESYKESACEESRPLWHPPCSGLRRFR